MALPFPGRDVPVVDIKTGLMTSTWHDYLKFYNPSLSGLADVSTTSPTNGQVLIWNSTTKLWAPGSN
jgi:hypothetical protein